MYTIIGADQREYGPVTAEQIRQWVAEGRANGATMAKTEGSNETAPLSTFPEFQDLWNANVPPLEAPPRATPTDPNELANYLRSRGYQIDIGHCVSRSWLLLKAKPGLILGATCIFALIALALTQLIGLFTGPAMQAIGQGDFRTGPIMVLVLSNIPEMALSTALGAGLYWILIKLIRGEPASLGDMFEGFRSSFVQLAAAGIVVQILTIVGFCCCIIPGIYLSVAWVFTVPLILDRQLDFWAAMELSRRVVTANWWQVFVLIIVVALINIAGVAACCIGLLAAFPLGMGALLYAYDDIFGAPRSASH